MVAWPATLPQTPLIGGYKETVPDLALRTQMDTGPAKVRRRATAGVRPFQWPAILTTAQVATLDTFYVTTLNSGALPFTVNHPRTTVSESWRIVEPPEYVPLSGSLHRVNLKMEILP